MAENEPGTNQYIIDGMIVDQVLYWWDQPVSYLGRIDGGDGRPHLVVLVKDDMQGQIYHRLAFEDETGLRASLADGVTASSKTYQAASEWGRLDTSGGNEDWKFSPSFEALFDLDGPPTSLPPGRKKGHVPVNRWGCSHQGMLLHLVDLANSSKHERLLLEYHRMRINPTRNVVQALGRDWNTAPRAWDDTMGSILADGSIAKNHDDFDCIEEFEAEGIIDILSTADGEIRMTQKGLDQAREILDQLDTEQ